MRLTFNCAKRSQSTKDGLWERKEGLTQKNPQRPLSDPKKTPRPGSDEGQVLLREAPDVIAPRACIGRARLPKSSRVECECVRTRTSMTSLTAKRLHQLLHYNQKTGEFSG
jgi:hypothetical protein